jgi:hypothetical protein
MIKSKPADGEYFVAAPVSDWRMCYFPAELLTPFAPTSFPSLGACLFQNGRKLA